MPREAKFGSLFESVWIPVIEYSVCVRATRAVTLSLMHHRLCAHSFSWVFFKRFSHKEDAKVMFWEKTNVGLEHCCKVAINKISQINVIGGQEKGSLIWISMATDRRIQLKPVSRFDQYRLNSQHWSVLIPIEHQQIVFLSQFYFWNKERGCIIKHAVYQTNKNTQVILSELILGQLRIRHSLFFFNKMELFVFWRRIPGARHR